MKSKELEVREVCQDYCEPEVVDRLAKYVKQGKFIPDGLHVDISSSMSHTMFEVMEALVENVKSVTVDLVGIASLDKAEAIFLSLRSIARCFDIPLKAVGGCSLAKYNQLVDFSEADKEILQTLAATVSCNLNISNRDLVGSNYMSGLLNMPRIETVEEFADVVLCAEQYLVCKLYTYKYPSCFYSNNFCTALGLNGLHEWFMQRGYPYDINKELGHWLTVYKLTSECELISDLLEKHRWRIPHTIRGILPCNYSGTTRSIEVMCELAVAKRLDKRGIKMQDILAKYSVSKQLEVQEYIQLFIDGNIRADIISSPSDKLSEFIDIAFDTDLSEINIILK